MHTLRYADRSGTKRPRRYCHRETASSVSPRRCPSQLDAPLPTTVPKRTALLCALLAAVFEPICTSACSATASAVPSGRHRSAELSVGSYKWPDFTFLAVPARGLEPRFRDSKSLVLPLDDTGAIRRGRTLAKAHRQHQCRTGHDADFVGVQSPRPAWRLACSAPWPSHSNISAPLVRERHFLLLLA